MATTRGVVQIHSAPSALCPHIEWAVGGAIGAPVRLDWRPQPAEPGALRTEHTWVASVGTAAQLASIMKRWAHLRFELTEEATATTEAERYSFTPSLGIFHATVGRHGDIMIGEDRLRAAMAEAQRREAALADALHGLLGTAWDDELEAFRQAGDGAEIRWLHRVG